MNPEFFKSLDGNPRLLVEVELQPLQGTRFQPTGFPDLGAAEYKAADGSDMLLLESAQSMANRLEAVCWQHASVNGGDSESTNQGTLATPLEGISFIEVLTPEGKYLTNSILESHRLNSPYILESKDKSFFNELKEAFRGMEGGRIELQVLASVLARYDVNSLLHGVFLAKKELAGGRLRIPRALSAFIEARNVRLVNSGGIKLDKIAPRGDSKKGFGHIPFHRSEYTGDITAYFNLDLAQIRGYRLGSSMEMLLISMALFKIQRFLKWGLRLRTACDLEVKEILIKRPELQKLPSLQDIEAYLPALVREVYGDENPVKTVYYKK